MPTSLELREQRAAKVAQARQILDKAEAEGRGDLNEQEQALWDSLTNEADELRSKAETEERKEYQTQAEDDLKKSTRRVSPSKPADSHDFDRYGRDALRAWFLGSKAVSSELRNAASHCGIDLNSRSLTINLPNREGRALTVGNTGAGGFTVAPQFGNRLVEALKLWGGMLGNVGLIQTASGADLPYPIVTDNIVGEIVGELQTVSEGDPVFSTVNLKAVKLSSRSVKLSLELLQDSAFDLENWLANALAVRIGKKLNQLFTTGTGGAEPQGIVPGITNTVTAAATYDSLVDMIAALEPAYLPNAKFMVRPDFLPRVA